MQRTRVATLMPSVELRVLDGCGLGPDGARRLIADPLQKALGKPVGADLREGKMTLPLIHLLQEEDEAGERIVRDIIASRTVTEEQWSQLRRLLGEHASIDYAFRRASEYADRAKKFLYVFPPSSERDALLALPDYVLSRDR